jgi:hypothetical protein
MFSPHDRRGPISAPGSDSGSLDVSIRSDTPATRELPSLQMVDDTDPAVVVLTCANCGAAMDERKCKLICRCGYFLSCSDYY